jgi:hypothetical protein
MADAQNGIAGGDALAGLTIGVCFGFIGGMAAAKHEAKQRETDRALNKLRLEVAALRPAEEVPVK